MKRPHAVGRKYVTHLDTILYENGKCNKNINIQCIHRRLPRKILMETSSRRQSQLITQLLRDGGKKMIYGKAANGFMPPI